MHRLKSGACHRPATIALEHMIGTGSRLPHVGSTWRLQYGPNKERFAMQASTYSIGVGGGRGFFDNGGRGLSHRTHDAVKRYRAGNYAR
jgi:hypothetical protein